MPPSLESSPHGSRPPASPSVLRVGHEAAEAVLEVASGAPLPRDKDPVWGEVPWALLPRARLAPSVEALRRMDGDRFDAICLLMALAEEEMARWCPSGVWVIREWLRDLRLGFADREAIELLVRAVRTVHHPLAPRWRARLAASVPAERLRRVMGALGTPLARAWGEGAPPLPSSPRERAAWWVAVEGRGIDPPPTSAAHLWLLVGIPGSGKSTWLARQGLRRVVCMDVIRGHLTGDMADQRRNDEVFAVAMASLRRELEGGHTVAFDATNVTPEARRTPLQIAAWTGARVTAVFFDVPFRTCVARNASRPRRVPVGALIRFSQHLVPPLPHEYDERVVVCA